MISQSRCAIRLGLRGDGNCLYQTHFCLFYIGMMSFYFGARINPFRIFESNEIVTLEFKEFFESLRHTDLTRSLIHAGLFPLCDFSCWSLLV